MKQIKDKGFFIMSDGTKSIDHEVPEKKKSAKAEHKSVGKKASALNKSQQRDKSAQKKKGKAAAKSKKSDDDLDIESEEDSVAQESD